MGRSHVACLLIMFVKGRLAMPCMRHENVRHATFLLSMRDIRQETRGNSEASNLQNLEIFLSCCVTSGQILAVLGRGMGRFCRREGALNFWAEPDFSDCGRTERTKSGIIFGDILKDSAFNATSSSGETWKFYCGTCGAGDVSIMGASSLAAFHRAFPGPHQKHAEKAAPSIFSA